MLRGVLIQTDALSRPHYHLDEISRQRWGKRDFCFTVKTVRNWDKQMKYANKEEKFWTEVRKRRDLFFLWFLGWIPFYIIYAFLTKAVFGNESPLPSATPFVFWAVSWGVVENRIRKLNCPNCHKQAFRHCLFFMKDAKCQHCGHSYQ